MKLKRMKRRWNGVQRKRIRGAGGNGKNGAEQNGAQWSDMGWRGMEKEQNGRGQSGREKKTVRQNRMKEMGTRQRRQKKEGDGK